MTKKVRTRLKLYGNRIVMYQLPWLVFWWRDWKPMNNELHKKDNEIVSTVEKLKKLLDQRKDIVAQLKLEEKDLEQRGQLESDEFQYTLKKGESLKYQKPMKPVDGKMWRPFISGKLTGDRSSMDIRERNGAPPRNGGERTAYVHPDFKQFNINLKESGEFDHVMDYRPPKKDSSNPRKRKEGETESEHKARLKRMDQGKKDDDYS